MIFSILLTKPDLPEVYFMKLNAYANAAMGAAMVVLGVNPSARAIVAVDVDTLFSQEAVLGQFSGVVTLQSGDINLSSPFCTGSLLTGGQYILTAAHCITESGTNTLDSTLLNQPFFANFNLASGLTQVPISSLFVLPTWTGSVLQGNDVALLSLFQPAPAEAEQYDIYRDTDELGQTFIKVGYGDLGTGEIGELLPNGLSAFFGQNQFEGTEANLVNLLNFPPSDVAPLSQLLFDFDSGFSDNNLLGSLGLGNNEVNTASGDSGGPAFIGDRIAGITSYGIGGFQLSFATDIDSEPYNSSFGELSGNTCVSTYSSYIDAVLLGNVAPSGQNITTVFEPIPVIIIPSDQEPMAVPEPTTVIRSVAFGLWLLKRHEAQVSDR